MQHSMQIIQPYIELTTLEQIPDVIQCLKAQLQQWKVAEEIQLDLKLCMTEALQNALLHGSLNNAEIIVKVMWKYSASTFCFIVEDNGKGIPVEQRNTVYEERLQENGRGLFLLHTILDELRFNEQGNRIEGILYW